MAEQRYQKGERRREEILQATLRVIGAHGADAVTHRAVAQEAGVAVSSTTYYFASKEELLAETLMLAAREETEHLERLVLDLAPLSLSPQAWAAAVTDRIASDLEREPARHVALFELGLEAARTEALRPQLQRWQEAHLRLAEMGCRAVGSPDPAVDARIVVSALTGLMLEALASPDPAFAENVMAPTLERLFVTLAAAERAAEPV